MNITGISNNNTSFGRINISEEADFILKKRLSSKKYAKLKERVLKDDTDAIINIYQYHSMHDRLAACFSKDTHLTWFGSEGYFASLFLSPERFINKCIKSAKEWREGLNI